MNHHYLPADLDPDRVSICIGLISDTHLPDRWNTLQPAIFETLAGADLILHAGDVGKLHVLDQLSVIAPVIAVHGNDETAEAQAALPYQQIIALNGTRILLCHSHIPDRAAELASRVGDAWQPKLATNADYARSFGATIYISGHLHIPFAVEVDGVWLINPGAIASGSPTTRQKVQSVALLYLRDDGRPFVVHVDVTHEPTVLDVTVDWGAGFIAAHSRYLASILTPDMMPILEAFRLSQFAEDPRTREMITALGRPVWAGNKERISREDLRVALQETQGFSAEERVLIRGLMNNPPVE